MNKLRSFLAVVFAALVLMPASVMADDYQKAAKVFRDSPVVAPYFKNSYGYAVFPTIGKGGIGIGGAHGSGQVYRGGKLTGKTSMTQVTIGWQLGGQAYSQIIFFEDKRSYNEFTSGNFEFGAQASAVAITAGAQAQTGTTGAGASASPGGSAGSQAKTSYHKGMAVFTRAKGGLMYEAAIGGQKFSFEPVGKK
jgi:lipid-binding SYLF domain-containing protein